MIIVYGIPNCNTVKKALAWFEENKVPFEFHNYKKNGITREKIEAWLTQVPAEKLINRAGTTFRQLSEAEKEASQSTEGAILLMLEKNSVIKRPIVEKGNTIIALGFNEEEYRGKNFN